MLSKRTEYIVSAVLALYVVFATRPAPAVVTSLLSSPVAQILALAAVVYVGATQSVVVAIVAALALVLSTPSREHMTDKKKPEEEAKKKPAAATKPKATPSAVKEASKKASAAAKPPAPEKEPEAAGQTLKAEKETFVGAAPF